jgi:Uma2 family endonuclease
MPPTIATPLAAFLTQPNIEASPAWELINGQAAQKPMPTLFHSRLQRNLVNWINQQTDRHAAIQALRCIIPPISPVPDIAHEIQNMSDKSPLPKRFTVNSRN